MITLILLIQGFEKVMLALFPLTNLLFIVFSVAIFAVGVNFNSHSYYTSALPFWANIMLFVISFFVLIIGGVGYYSGTRGRFTYLMIYILVLVISSFMCLITGLAMLIKTSSIKEAVSKEWAEVSNKLKESGYNITESTFSNFLEVNLKFGGLFVIVFCLFLVVGLIPAVYLSLILKKKNVMVKGIGGHGLISTPYRLNSD